MADQIVHTFRVNETLVLTNLLETDKARIIQVAGDERVHRTTLLIPHPYTEADANEFLTRVKSTVMDTQCQHLAIRDTDMQFLGIVGLHVDQQGIGFYLDPAYWGQGIMTTIVKYVLTRVIPAMYPEWKTIRDNVFVGNEASLKVHLKAGFTLEGVEKDTYTKDGKSIDSWILTYQCM
jgi:RimJ/RimL family protein N-acetyltransferase